MGVWLQKGEGGATERGGGYSRGLLSLPPSPPPLTSPFLTSLTHHTHIHVHVPHTTHTTHHTHHTPHTHHTHTPHTHHMHTHTCTHHTHTTHTHTHTHAQGPPVDSKGLSSVITALALLSRGDRVVRRFLKSEVGY